LPVSQAEVDLAMNDERRLQRARAFDDIAELYDQARREPPEQLFTDLFALAAIEPTNANVLEIGCGTGQATLPLARRGCRVVGVEMGPNLARIARRKLSPFPGVKVVNARFEEWESNDLVDIVVAVTSWHWLDPRLRYARAAAALRPGGVLAFTTGGHAFPRGFDPFFSEIRACYEAMGETGFEWPPAPPQETPDAREEIEQSGYFDDVRVARRLWVEEFTADEYVRLLSTFSDHRLMEAAKRERLFGEVRQRIAARRGGCIRKHNLTILHVARRKSC
jgi:SAM-dependent methyltransferase